VKVTSAFSCAEPCFAYCTC